MLLWLSEAGKIWGYQAFWSCSVDFPHYGDHFFGWNWSYLGFLGIIWRTCGSKCQGEGGGIFPTLCVECCLVPKCLRICSNSSDIVSDDPEKQKQKKQPWYIKSTLYSKTPHQRPPRGRPPRLNGHFILAPLYFLCKFYVTKPLVTGHPANTASGRWIWCPVTLMSVMLATKGAARDCNWHLDGPDRPAVTASSQRLAGQARRGVKFTAAEPSSGQALWPAFDGDLLNCHNDVVKRIR